MKISQPDYQIQISNAKATLSDLQAKLNEVEALLLSDPQNTSHLRRRQKIHLDITITENELDHAQQKFRH